MASSFKDADGRIELIALNANRTSYGQWNCNKKRKFIDCNNYFSLTTGYLDTEYLFCWTISLGEFMNFFLFPQAKSRNKC